MDGYHGNNLCFSSLTRVYNGLKILTNGHGISWRYCFGKLWICAIVWIQIESPLNLVLFSGVAVRMNKKRFNLPSFNGLDTALFFPQNLPSIVVGHVLNVQNGDVVLDMCAAPGMIPFIFSEKNFFFRSYHGSFFFLWKDVYYSFLYLIVKYNDTFTKEIKIFRKSTYENLILPMTGKLFCVI